MASSWIKCTASDGKTDVYINLANAVSLIAHKTGARIDDVAVSHADAPEETAAPIVSGSFEPWIR